MRIVLSDRCDREPYVRDLEGYNVRIVTVAEGPATDYHIISVESEGIVVAEYGDDITDYSKELTETFEWDEIEEIYVY